MEIHNSIQKNEQPQIKGEIILYQPTEDIRIEARIVYETIWLTQQQLGVIVILQAKTCKFCSNSQIAGSNFG